MLENAASRASTPEETCKAKAMLKDIKSRHIVKFLHLMLDILQIITATSKIFQTHNLMLTDGPSVIAETQMSICVLRTTMGMNMATFTTSDQSQLTGPELAAYKDDNDVQVLRQTIDKYLEKRFNTH